MEALDQLQKSYAEQKQMEREREYQSRMQNQILHNQMQ